jgi:hypothetical protein
MQEGISHVRERILPVVRTIAGFSGVLFLADRESGKALSITLWVSEQTMQKGSNLLNSRRHRPRYRPQ